MSHFFHIYINLLCVYPKENDIILIDRSLFDRLIWVDRLHLKGELKKEEYEEHVKQLAEVIEDIFNNAPDYEEDDF